MIFTFVHTLFLNILMGTFLFKIISSSDTCGKKAPSTNDFGIALLAESDTGEEYFDSDFCSIDNEYLSLAEGEELGVVESEEKEQVPAIVVASVSASSSVISSKFCKSRGDKAAQIFGVHIQQTKDREKFK